MAESLIKMLIAGPDVSFNGSPTVSPTTAAICLSLILAALSAQSLSSAYLASSSANALNSASTVLGLIPALLASALKADLSFSTPFLALSQAPPVFEAEIAT